MDDRRPNPSLADDPAFIAGLDGLDSGLDDPSAPRPAALDPVESLSPASVAPVDPPPAPVSPRRRSVLELFPPIELKPVPRGRPTPPPRTPPAANRPVAAASPASPKEYLTFYGLHEEPFSLAPDPRFFFHSVAHDDAVQNLLTAIRRREGVVLVTGVEGAGKTTLCRTVVEHLDRRTITSFVGEVETFADLVKAALVGFGVIATEELAAHEPPVAELLVTFREFLLSLSRLQAFAVLFVDDAGKIASSALREVVTLADTGADERLLEVVLIGDSRLVRKLGRGELKPLARLVTLRCPVGVLESDEIPGYVVHRLLVAAPNPRVEFGDDAFDRLAVLSRGVPRLVNVLCDYALESGAASGAATIDAERIDEAAAALGIDPPETRMARASRRLVAVLILVALMGLGAGAAAFVFQDRVAAAISNWRRAAPPRPPVVPRTQPLAPGRTPPPGGSAASPPPSAAPAVAPPVQAPPRR